MQQTGFMRQRWLTDLPAALRLVQDIKAALIEMPLAHLASHVEWFQANAIVNAWPSRATAQQVDFKPGNLQRYLLTLTAF